jgi:hypothetical protein
MTLRYSPHSLLKVMLEFKNSQTKIGIQKCVAVVQACVRDCGGCKGCNVRDSTVHLKIQRFEAMIHLETVVGRQPVGESQYFGGSEACGGQFIVLSWLLWSPAINTEIE